VFDALEEDRLDAPSLATTDDQHGLDALLQLVQALPTGYRTVFNLHALEGYSHQEIAVMLNISESTSKSQLFKARNTLQMWLGAQSRKEVER
jgi:RNA polymerase sigma-70 factor (ECF subfamily)